MWTVGKAGYSPKSNMLVDPSIDPWGALLRVSGLVIPQASTTAANRARNTF